jgi:dihydroneopterin triphosphate diphosphatase
MPDIRADAIAVYVFRRVAGKLELLQIHRSDSTGEYQRSWQTVYGGVEKGETAVQAALRELREETGLVPRRMFQVEYLESFYFMPHDYVLVMPVFGVEVEATAAVTLNHEHDDFRWIPAAEMEAAFMWRTQREAVRCLLEAIDHPTESMPLLTVNIPPHLAR